MKRFEKRTLMLAAVVLVSTACEKSTSPRDVGSHQATLAGDFAGSLSGSARFVTDTVSPPREFWIALVSTRRDTSWYVSLSVEADNPTLGTYPIGDKAYGEYGALVRLCSPPTLPDHFCHDFVASAGSVDITEASPSRVKGTFTATFSSPSPERTFSVEGVFNAVCDRNLHQPSGGVCL